MKKKTIFTVCILLSLLLAVTGCQADKDSDNAPVVNQGATDTAKQENEAPAEETDAISFPLEEPVSMTAVYRYAVGILPFEDLEYFDIMEEMSNVIIEFIGWDDATKNEKKQMAFAGGDLPDIMINLASTDDLVLYGGQGMILSLDDMLEDCAPNLTISLNERPDIKRSITMPDGHIYGLPYMYEQPVTSNTSFMYNMDWISQLGKGVPTTLDEFTEILRLIKTTDLNGNGKNDEIPWSFVWNTSWRSGCSYWSPIMGAFGMPLSDDYIVEDGVVKYAHVQDATKQAMEYMHMLYSEGLLDPEFSTLDYATFDAKCQADPPRVGFTQHWSTQIYNVAYEEDVYGAMPPLKGPNGAQKWGRYENILDPAAVVITNTCEYPEIAVMWADIMQDQDMALQGREGLFGVLIEKQADGTIKKLPTESGSIAVHTDIGQMSPHHVTGLVLRETVDLIEIDPNDMKLAEQPIYEPYLPDIDYLYPEGVTFTSEEIEEMSAYATDVGGYVDRMLIEFVTNGGIDEGWDEYVANVNKMGLEDLLKIRQQAYDRYMSVD